MFGMGLSLRIANFRMVVSNPRAMVIGFLAQMLLLPVFAFLIAHLFQLPPQIAVGLMIIALAPGGATSNMFSYLSRGDVSLSSSLTSVVSLVTPFIIPLVTVWCMQYFMGDATPFVLPIGKTIVQLLLITVLPVALGMFMLSRWPMAAGRIEAVLKWFSVFFLFLVVALIGVKNAAQMSDFFVKAGLATLVLNVSTLGLGYWLAKAARLASAQAITIGYEVGIQNGTLALVVAGTLIGNQAMMIPAVTYSLIMFASGALFG